jgi:O-antigen/teichoic acid export membrane protein
MCIFLLNLPLSVVSKVYIAYKQGVTANTWAAVASLASMHLLISPYLWPAFGEAYARREIVWMRQAYLKYLTASLSIGIPLLLLVFFHDLIITKWAGPEALPLFTLVIWMALWSLILLVMSPIVSVLGGTGHLKGYLRSDKTSLTTVN